MSTTTTIEPGERTLRDEHDEAVLERAPGSLTLAAVASLSAGAVHAAAIGSHSEHAQAAKTFAVIALLQLLWGGFALIRRGRAVATAGVVLNGVLFAGWVLAKWRGITFVDGLDEAEAVQFADGLCAALALLSAVAAGAVLLRSRLPRVQPLVATTAIVVVSLVSLPGMVEAGRHAHQLTVVNAAAKTIKATALVPRYDPKQPIDLGGVKGVSQAQQARAEGLVADTLIRLPAWGDVAKARAAGYRPLAPSTPGFERLIKWSSLNDSHRLDPDHPEGLVYRVQGAKRTLVSAIFMLKPGSDVKRLPDIGGPLAPWDTHTNLCATRAGSRFAFADAKGACPTGQVKLAPVPTTHVWIVAHPCGPFALSSEGAGKVGRVARLVCPAGHPAGGAGTTL